MTDPVKTHSEGAARAVKALWSHYNALFGDEFFPEHKQEEFDRMASIIDRETKCKELEELVEALESIDKLAGAKIDEWHKLKSIPQLQAVLAMGTIRTRIVTALLTLSTYKKQEATDV